MLSYNVKKILTVVSIIAILAFLFIIYLTKTPNKEIVEAPKNPPVVEVTEGPYEKCYSRATIATTEKPFAVEEYVKLKFDKQKVEGYKFGFQSGPGYSNGYSGTLIGTITDTDILVDFAYTVEGSKNTEEEVYLKKEGSLEKIQYQLLEKGKKLVPDRNKEVNRLLYPAIDCKIYEEKLPR